ncbi:MAG: SUMF1/EgtB/PvdO family nonheme iron enzyme [Planctomycetes bacterium]|nr:SUMF1/EgtB/PvdO family nonheme iron enzyme [Planctomycetota bacterium]
MITTLLVVALQIPPLQPQASLVSNAKSEHDLVMWQSSGESGDEKRVEMVLIPGGDVVVGTDPDDVQRLGDNNLEPMTLVAAETPRHTAHVDTFYIDLTEVTNLQWKVYLEATGRQPSSDLVEYGWGSTSIPAGREYHPVSNVTVPEVQAFLAWCGKRLPTEEEWTRAARGDDDRTYPWGSKWDSKVLQSGASVPQDTSRVGSFAGGVSPFGVLDMAGNVWELVDSPFAPFDGYKNIKHKVGKKETILSPEFNRTNKVAKGGCYLSTRDFARIDTRLRIGPSDSDAALGFRGARSARDGVEMVLAGYRNLLPPQISKESDLDLNDVFAEERTYYDADRQVITGYRAVAFAHPAAKRGSGLLKLQKDSRDDPITLGLLATTEEIENPPLPAGQYLLQYKVAGESKKHKEKRKEDKGKKGKDDDLPEASEGAAVPWPGVSVNDIIEDIEFPQDKDVILYLNVNSAVVGWTSAPDPSERPVSPQQASTTDGGKTWKVEFSLDTVDRKVPRFFFEFKLRGQGFAPTTK